MARRSRRMTKVQPAVMKFNFKITKSDNSSDFLDLSLIASILNRRFYRQGLNWAVGGFTFHTEQLSTPIGPALPNPQLRINKLPGGWVFNNAWTKGMKAWAKMNDEAFDQIEAKKGKFLDFKIYMNENHYKKGDSLLPIDSEEVVAVPGDWEYSEYHVPITAPAGSALFGSTRTNKIMGVGRNYGAAGNEFIVSLVDGYANSRNLPSIIDPNSPGDMADTDGGSAENWLAALFNEGTNQTGEVIDDQLDYDQPPYPFENDGTHFDTMYPGGQTQLPNLEIHDRAQLTNTTIGGKTYLQGGTFPCGLVEIAYSNLNVNEENTRTFYLEVAMVPGTHRGYLAESMLEA